MNRDDSSPAHNYAEVSETKAVYSEVVLPTQPTNQTYTSLTGEPVNESYYETGKNHSKEERSCYAERFMCVVSVVVVILTTLCLLCCFALIFSLIETFNLKSQLNLIQKNLQLNSSALSDLRQELHANRKTLNEQNQQLFDTLESLGQSCNLAASCASLLASSPSTPSGYYWVKSNNGSVVRVYCDMTRSCGEVTGGWTRVAELDTNNTTQCPGDLHYLDGTFTKNISVCRINGTFRFGVCSPATFNLNGILYSRVCGRIKAYQFGTPEAFHLTQDIDSVYVDGISLTHGNPRQHIWTFAADSNTNSTNCPCSPSHQTTPTPSLDFVGEDYFCNTASDDSSLTYHFDNPVWDGDDCIPGNMCCSFNSPPWFYKQLPRPTTDDIEMRVCADDLRSIEDIGIESLEIYVQ